MNAITCRTRITANRVVHFVATGSGLTIASLFFLAPAASAATPAQLCELEQGPNGLQCVQQPKQAELCDLEMGPNGIQCVEDQLDEKAPDPQPEPPADPEPQPEPPADPDPQPEPDVDEAPAPKADPGIEAQAPVSEEAVDGVPEFEIAAGPAVEQSDESHAGWAGLALLSSGLLWFYARRRHQVREDAVAALERM